MRQLVFTLTILAGLATPSAAQAPDVVQSGTLTALGHGTPIWVGGGGPQGAVGWRLTYFVDGTQFTAAAMAIQGADAPTAAACNSASYSTITTAGSSTVEVANPSTSGTQGNVGVKTYYPCIIATLTGVTGSAGTVTYQLAGWKNLFIFSQTVSATITAPIGQKTMANSVSVAIASDQSPVPVTASGTGDVNLAKVAGTNTVTGGVAGTQGVGGPAAAAATTGLGNPLQQGAIDNGGAIRPVAADTAGDIVQMCNNPATITQTFNALTTSGAQRIISGTANTRVRFCEFIFSTGTPEDLTVIEGTGADCSGGTTGTITGFYSVSAVVLDPLGSLKATTTGNDVCVNPSAVQNARVTVTYVKI